jgi:two-component system, sensor histidine kinase and response regulator
MSLGPDRAAASEIRRGPGTDSRRSLLEDKEMMPNNAYERCESSLRGQVLIIEPSKTVAMVMQALLSQAGLTVDRADTAGQALVRLATTVYDAILADAAMALPDGRNLLQALREDGAAPPVPVIALLGQDVTTFREDLVDTIPLKKPVTRTDLLNAVDAALGNRQDAGADLPLLDRDTMAQLWPSDNEPLFRRVAAIFLDEMEKRCAAIDRASSVLNRDTIRREAHGLKGAAMNLCAARLAAIAGELETSSETAPQATLARYAARLRSAATATSPVLHELIDRPDRLGGNG